MRFYILFAVLLLLSCFLKAQNSLNEQRDKWEFSQWPQMFKDRALCLCVLEGYQDSAIKRRILSLDKSYYNPVGYAIFDSILIPFIQNEVESLNRKAKISYGRVSEAKAGKIIFTHCLMLYKSQRLTQLVNKTSPGWYKIQDIDEVINRKVPTF